MNIRLTSERRERLAELERTYHELRARQEQQPEPPEPPRPVRPCADDLHEARTKHSSGAGLAGTGCTCRMSASITLL